MYLRVTKLIYKHDYLKKYKNQHNKFFSLYLCKRFLYLQMQRFKPIAIILWIVVIVSLIVAQFTWKTEKKECYPKENTCGIGTWLEDLQCQSTYFEKKLHCMNTDYFARNESVKKEVSKLSWEFAELKTVEKNLLEIYKLKQAINNQVPKSFPSELVPSQN